MRPMPTCAACDVSGDPVASCPGPGALPQFEHIYKTRYGCLWPTLQLLYGRWVNVALVNRPSRKRARRDLEPHGLKPTFFTPADADFSCFAGPRLWPGPRLRVERARDPAAVCAPRRGIPDFPQERGNRRRR